MSDQNNSNTGTKRNAPSTSNNNQLQKRGKIVLLGDSITQLSLSATLCGWGSYLADVYQRRCDVYNRGMSGYNTDWYLHYLETEEGYNDVYGMMMTKTANDATTATATATTTTAATTVGDKEDETGCVKLVTIFFGANDASCKELNPRHHVPISRFESNLKQIVEKSRANYGSNVKIIFITPPPVCHKSRLEYQVQLYKEKATGQLERNLSLSGEYADAVERVAQELKLPCLNIWKAMQNQVQMQNKKNDSNNGDDNDNDNDNDGDDDNVEKISADKGGNDGKVGKEPWSIYLSDGLHLSQEGNLFVGKKLVDMINKVYPEISITPCPNTNSSSNSCSKGGVEFGTEGVIGPWHDEIDHLDVGRVFKLAKKTKL